MDKKLRVALAQVNTTVGDLRGNSEKIKDRAEKAAAKGAQIITFPELCVCGYPPEDLLLREDFASACGRALEELAREIPPGLLALVGCVEGSPPGRLYNACALITGSRIHGFYRKSELPNYGVFDEKRYFREGNNPFIFSINGIFAGINICEDIWQDNSAEAQVKAGARVIFNISASPFCTGKRRERSSFIAEKAKKLGIPVCYNNAVGGQDELVFDGGSFIVDGVGRELASAPQFEESLVLCDLAPEQPGNTAKTSFGFNTAPPGPGKLPAVNPPVELSGPAEIYSALVLGTRDYFLKNGFKKAVTGISGGIDSALTTAVAKDALGQDRVTGVFMPTRFTSRESGEDSKALAGLLGIRIITVSAEPVFKASMKTLENVFEGTAFGPAEENLQARIRGNLLMAISNKFGCLVITSGNKSEIACGYCTLYGDMAGGFSILKDVYKTTVYTLAEYRNSLGEAIPGSIINKAPTAELKPQQKDSDTLPPYDILDKILYEYIEKNAGPGVLSKTTGFEEETVSRVVSMVDASEFKRRQGPPGIKVTARALGKDRRMPLTNLYRPGEK